MNINRKVRKQRAGLPPGTLLEKEKTPAQDSQLTLISYSDEAIQEEKFSKDGDFASLSGNNYIKWLDIVGIKDSGLLQKIGSAYDIHPLVLEDIQNTDQRPKIENYGTYLYVVVKMLWWDKEAGEIRPEQVSLLLLKDMVISFQEAGGDTFEIIRKRIRGHQGRIRTAGADYLLYALIDSIVDYYFHITEEIEERLSEAENSVLLGKDEQITSRLYTFNTQLTELRRSFQPLREVIFQLQKREFPFIEKKTQLFINDIGDHLYIITDTHDTLRENLINLQNIHTANMSNRMNSVMKVLTIIATIFIPLTFIVGVYGMNFQHMPELKIPWAYPLVLGVMGVIVIVMLILFKRKKWL